MPEQPQLWECQQCGWESPHPTTATAARYGHAVTMKNCSCAPTPVYLDLTPVQSNQEPDISSNKVVSNTGLFGVSPCTPTEDVLEEALRITSTDRNAEYGPPERNQQAIADVWNGLLGDQLKTPITATQACVLMAGLKCVRAMNPTASRDSFVDGAGYFRIAHLCKNKPTTEP